MGRVIKMLFWPFASQGEPFFYPLVQEAEPPPTSALQVVSPTPSTTMELPSELWLHCFSFMTLKALITSRGVCTTWRRLVPLAFLDPVRRRLLALYDTMINSPWTVAHLELFDRETYITALAAQYPALPPDFRMFILEWPGRATIRFIWPGLPLLECRTSNIERSAGINFIARRPPQLSALIFKYGYPDVEFVPALLVWRRRDSTTRLIFDKRPELFGKVFIISDLMDPDIIPYDVYGDGTGERMDYSVLEREGDYGDFIVRDDWLDYVGWMWHHYDHYPSPKSRTVLPHDDIDVDLKGDPFVDDTHRDNPAPPWVRREEAQFLQRLKKD